VDSVLPVTKSTVWVWKYEITVNLTWWRISSINWFIKFCSFSGQDRCYNNFRSRRWWTFMLQLFTWDLKEEEDKFEKINQDLTHFLQLSSFHYWHQYDCLSYQKWRFSVQNHESSQEEIQHVYRNALKECSWLLYNSQWFLKDKDLVIWCDKWLRIYNDLKETEIMKINAAKHDFFDCQQEDWFFIAGIYAWDYIELDFKILVIKFKDYYKTNSCSKQLFSSQTSFAAFITRQIQSRRREITSKYLAVTQTNHLKIIIEKTMNALVLIINILCDQSATISIWLFNLLMSTENSQVQKKIDSSYYCEFMNDSWD
jgi:hypothetical protein